MKGIHPAFYFSCWLVGLLSFVPLTLILQTIAPRLSRRASDVLERGPWQSLLVGTLGVGIALLALIVVGKAGGVGKFLGFVVLTALAVAVAFGFASVFRSLGSRMYFSMNSPRADLAFPATLLGGAVLWMTGLLPIVGQIVLIIAGTIGFGGCLIAVLGRREKAVAAPGTH